VAETRVANTLVGIAGVHFVVSELSLRGLIALPTIRNTAGVDILVSNLEGSWHSNLQVKTSQRRVTFWPIGHKYEGWLGKNNYYVFVRYLPKEAKFEVFLESASRVVRETRKYMAECRDRGLKEWSPSWNLPKDKVECERLQRQWYEFGRSTM